ncbi:MAG: TonB-dependent receptor [Bacteroidaceae bacterium]|nr:TonB-dependent receptor [Bacteroidaceae bacterium]
MLFVALLCLSFQMLAQTQVKGVVYDGTDGSPMIGVKVMVTGTNTGTITDYDGNYTISVPQGKTLTYSMVGFKPQTIDPKGRTTIDVTLEEDSKMLNDVVVVGYGTMKKSDISGASVTIGEDAVKGSLITSLDQSFQGRVAGIQATNTSGAPGSSSSIRVRGQATINANAEPLYVIDGVIVQSGGNNGQNSQSGASFGLGDALGNGSMSTISPLATIDPSDIVSMEILKDASATAIYGAQGANGVVLITTKHGKAGEAKFSYNGNFAVNRQQKRLDMMNLREYAEYYNSLVDMGEIYENNPMLADPSILGKGTNWQDAVFQTALQHSHQVSAQGGTDKVQYYASGSYMNQEGTIIGSNFNRFSFRTNLDAQMKSWLKFGMTAAFSNSNDDLKLADSNEGLIYYSLTTPPNIPIYNVDGSYSSVSQEGYTSPNPIAIAMEDDILLNRQKLNGNFFFDVNPFKFLTWHTELGYDFNWSTSKTYEPTLTLGTYNRTQNSASQNKSSSKFWSLKNYLTWSQQFDKHNVTGMVGQELWESRYDWMQISSTGLPSDDVHSPALGDLDSQKFNNGFGSSSMASFFTRWTYSYNNRYNATYTYRYDGSSNFGPNNRWAGFHSVAASWRFTEEEFMKDVNWLSNGKLRIGWGQTGNSNIGGYRWGSGISKMESIFGISYRPSNIANPDVKWETQEQWNIGLDLGFFKDRLNFTFEWYNKESRDMLMLKQVPSYMGINENTNPSIRLEAPFGNFGHIRNRGVEFTIDAHPLVGKFEWDLNFNISHNKNTLVSLNDGSGNKSLIGWGQWSDVVTESKVGESLYSFYGYKTDGIYTSLEDIENSPKPQAAPSDGVYKRTSTVWVGDIKYKDLNDDNVINTEDRTNIGSPMPKFTFGFTNTFRYKNFDLTLFLNGSVGNKILNYNAITLTHMYSSWTNQTKNISDRAILVPIDPNKDYSQGTILRPDGSVIENWYDDITNVKVKNPDAGLPRPSLYGDPNDNDRISDRYIEDGSYLRVRNISLGYTFPKQMLSKAKIESLRLYTNIQNLWTITGYSGYDPEVGVSTTSANVYGLDNGRYPSPTTYSVGVNLTF